MTASTDAMLLDLWEVGAGEHPIDRALTLLSGPTGEPRAALARLPIDERDMRLFRLAESLFGPELQLTSVCPDCGGETELDLRLDDILSRVPAPGRPGRRLVHDGRALAYRLPDSADLARALRQPDPDAARRALLADLIDEADPAPALLDALEARLAEEAGIEDLRLAHDCAECGARHAAGVDILDILWRRIAARAQQLLWDIHILARGYGWTSGEILALSPARRAAHIAMVTA
ncbi:hypothetical protein [Poseidonocella sedimentorum]|uniref:T4 bacteriophage base plate protein n=1 Tax=Poseidonocella sedimentorum TaxID=871652 RepID=A0A1I6DP61_9RHOB|nr:hypothetical protein [Poseidonocella sedimentorum]SFR07206.1 hypothetical protein SAMN04515673_104194 [Poseidonocella sedimentorum]